MINKELISNFYSEDFDFPWVTEKEIELGNPIIEADYDAVKTEIGFDLRPLFHSVVSVYDRFKFRLSYDNRVISECVIDGVIMTFNQFAQEHYIHAFEDFGKEFITFAKQFYPIDIYEKATDEVTLTAVKICPDNSHGEFWIWNNAGPKYKLRFKTLEEYIIAGVENKFCVDWQYFYIDTEEMDLTDSFTQEHLASDYSDAIYSMKSSLELMTTYFPEDNWSNQENELKRIKEI